MANKYPKKNQFINEKKHNMKLIFCSSCKIVQTKIILSRKKMFEDYYYLSSVNKGLVRHFENLANKFSSANFVLDIGSNDGILLNPLIKNRVQAIGIDPSKNVGKIANDKGLFTIIDFFNSKSANKIKKKYSQPDVIVASSIFTHLKNPLSFAKNIKLLLQDNGLFILEIEYLKKFIINKEFERFYFDRPFYYSLKSIMKLFKSVDMSFIDIEFINIHGGSIRCYIKNRKNLSPSTRLKQRIIDERKIINIKYLRKFEKEVYNQAKILKNKLLNYKQKGLKIIGYGSPARVSTITNLAKIDNKLIEYIIDDNPLKQNRFTPGMHIPIKNRSFLKKNSCDIVIVFAYDYFDDIKIKMLDQNCKFYKPIPFKKLK